MALPLNQALDRLLWNEAGLIPVTTVQFDSGVVLMAAWVNREALELSLAQQQAVYWSRSRGELWIKGLTSGNTQRLVDIRVDCDGDAIMYLVDAAGPACHTGRRSCFSWRLSQTDGLHCDRPIESDVSTSV